MYYRYMVYHHHGLRVCTGHNQQGHERHIYWKLILSVFILLKYRRKNVLKSNLNLAPISIKAKLNINIDANFVFFESFSSLQMTDKEGIPHMICIISFSQNISANPFKHDSNKNGRNILFKSSTVASGWGGPAASIRLPVVSSTFDSIRCILDYYEMNILHGICSRSIES